MMFFKYLIPFATVVALLGCGGHRSSEATEARTGVVTDSLGIIHPDYAKGFNVSYQDDMVLLNIDRKSVV